MSMPLYEKVWMGVGFLGQAIFTARFVVQWAASEKKKESVMPVAFWWISVFGGLTLLSYTIHKQDPPLILGQGMGLVVYVRNLMLVSKARRRAERRRLRIEAARRLDRTRGRRMRPRTRECGGSMRRGFEGISLG